MLLPTLSRHLLDFTENTALVNTESAFHRPFSPLIPLEDKNPQGAKSWMASNLNSFAEYFF